MKNLTKILALTFLFTGLSLNAELASKDNNLSEIKTTRSQRVLKFAKDHKKKLIAAAAIYSCLSFIGLWELKGHGIFLFTNHVNKLNTELYGIKFGHDEYDTAYARLPNAFAKIVISPLLGLIKLKEVFEKLCLGKRPYNLEDNYLEILEKEYQYILKYLYITGYKV